MENICCYKILDYFTLAILSYMLSKDHFWLSTDFFIEIDKHG